MPLFFDSFPDVDVLLDLAPEELAAKILFHLRQENSENHHFQDLRIPTERNDLIVQREKVEICLMEAWAWLESQGLLISVPGTNGQNGFRFLSRRARQFENDQDFPKFVHACRLPQEILHDRIRQKVWAAFVRGEYDTAVFQAMRSVEVYVREAAGYDRSQHGASMMRNAFNVDTGPLTDLSLESAEKESVGHLFAGAYGYFRNPNAHHDVPFNSPSEAMEIVLLANHLLRIVDAAVTRQEKENSSK